MVLMITLCRFIDGCIWYNWHNGWRGINSLRHNDVEFSVLRDHRFGLLLVHYKCLHYSKLWFQHFAFPFCAITYHYCPLPMEVELKISGWIHYGTLQAWLTFGHAPLNSCPFLASDWASSYCTFADKPLIGLTSNLVGKLYRPDGPC